MTQSELKSWLTTHYKRGQRPLFVAHFNEVAKALSAPPISEGAENKTAPALNNWLSRNPPANYGGIAFERFLGLVLERKNNPEPPAAIYTVQIALDEAEHQALLKTARAAETTPEQFLATCLRISFEDECGIE